MFFISQAHAQAAGGAPAGGGATIQILIMVGIFALMWFFMIRPQQKRAKEHRNMLAALKKGDEVMTNGGIMGRVIALNQQALDLEIAKGIVIRFQRQFISQVLPKGSLKGTLDEAPAALEEEKKED